MKRLLTAFLAFITILSLSSCSKSTSNSEEKIVGVNLGVTKNQVIEQMGYSEDYYFDSENRIMYNDIKVFEQYCAFADFWFENNELESISIHYPSGVDNDAIVKALEKAYGKKEDSAVDSCLFFSYNNMSICYLMAEDQEDTSSISISKNSD